MQKKQKNKKGPKKVTKFLGGLENGHEVVPPFFSKKSGSSKSSKTPIFIAFPENWVATIFFEKGYVKRRTALEGKNDNFLVSFRHKCLRKCQTQKKGRKREAQSWQSSCCFCCCWLFLYHWFFFVVSCCCCWCCCCWCCCCFCCCCSYCCCHFFVVIVVVIVFVVVLLIVLVVVLSPEHPKETKNQKTLVFFPVCFALFSFSLSLSLSFSCFLFLSFLYFLFPLFPFLFFHSFFFHFFPFFFSSILFVPLFCWCNSNSCFCCS